MGIHNLTHDQSILYQTRISQATLYLSYHNPPCIKPSYLNPSRNNPLYLNPSCIYPSYLYTLCINPSYLNRSCIKPSYLNPPCIYQSYLNPSFINPLYGHSLWITWGNLKPIYCRAAILWKFFILDTFSPRVLLGERLNWWDLWWGNTPPWREQKVFKMILLSQ